MKAAFLTILATFTFASPAQAVSIEEVTKLIVSGFVPTFAANREIVLNKGSYRLLCRLNGLMSLETHAPSGKILEPSNWAAASKTHARIDHNRVRIFGEFVDASFRCTVLSRAKVFRTNFELTRSGTDL